MKDGWHRIENVDVYVYNNKVMKLSYTYRNQYVVEFPYKRCKNFGGWDRVTNGISVSTFRRIAKGNWENINYRFA